MSLWESNSWISVFFLTFPCGDCGTRNTFQFVQQPLLSFSSNPGLWGKKIAACRPKGVMLGVGDSEPTTTVVDATEHHRPPASQCKHSLRYLNDPSVLPPYTGCPGNYPCSSFQKLALIIIVHICWSVKRIKSKLKVRKKEWTKVLTAVGAASVLRGFFTVHCRSYLKDIKGERELNWSPFMSWTIPLKTWYQMSSREVKSILQICAGISQRYEELPSLSNRPVPAEKPW